MSDSLPLSIQTLVESQDALVREASLALPGQFTQCTYDLGPLKQSVYLCVTCGEERGVCGACSIACHADHEQIELFPKRQFRCDCPTTSIPHHPCTLKTPPQPPNADNVYGQNFRQGGLFCRCATVYDVRLERETMVQCVSCEDWFHESCLNLRERVAPRVLEPEVEMKTEPTGDGVKQEPGSSSNPIPTTSNIETFTLTNPPTTSSNLPTTASDQPTTSSDQPTTTSNPPPPAATEEDDASSTASDPDLPLPLITGDTYDALICGQCVLKNPTVRRYAGTPGARIVVLDSGGWRVVGGGQGEGNVGGDEDVKVDGDEDVKAGGDIEVDMDAGAVKTQEPATATAKAESSAGTKRRASTDVSQPTKRARPEEDSSSRCLAPPVNQVAQKVFDDLQNLHIVKSEEGEAKSGPGRATHATGDVFLSEGWRERWCRCETCDPPLLLQPYLLHEEETYEPPQDPDAGLSLEELGMRALQSLPREHALDSIRAYNSMRDDLMLYLRPFADSGREVREEDITAFFASRRSRA